ncbi:ornithine carbamoyltransferase [Candidatus Nitrosocosmicus sp.]|nr:ornithine carbamoyltransferase [Candidatus Nitrosocosmicus sp.]
MPSFLKDLICTQDWSIENLDKVLNLAVSMKLDRYSPRWKNIFENKNFLMMFFSPSVRTHLSFTAAATELGGHAQYLEPAMARFKSKDCAGETIEDAAQVISKYMAGIGIRMMEGAVSNYGEGNKFIREYAKYAKIPVINMADDVCHPCQALADIMGWAEYFSGGLEKIDFSKLRNKTLLLTWGRGALARAWNSPQASLLLASRYGMNIKIARPLGYDMDPEIYQFVKGNCMMNNTNFELIDDPVSGYRGADVVYSRHWISPQAYYRNRFNKQDEIEKALAYVDWITTEEKMRLTENAIFTHPMPVDRGNEVEDSVASGKQSVIYNVAGNRLHVQKSVLALTMGNI